MTYRLNIIVLLIFTINVKHVLSQISSSSDCTIKDGIQIHTYDFSQLSNSDVKIKDDNPQDTIRLRLCSSLLEKCDGRDGYSICLTKDGKDIGIGKSPMKLKNVKNTLLFNSTGDMCESNKNYTVIIIMKCDYSAPPNSRPQLFPDREDRCKLHMIWNTKLACVPAITSNCSVVDQFNNTYDLSPLRKSSDNYIVYLDKSISHKPGNHKMIINICHSIIHENGATCARPAGACLVDSSNTSDIKYINYGEPRDNSLIYENKILKIKYTDGYICEVRESLLEVKQTTISFICDPAAIAGTEPEFSNESKPCDYKFIWKTAAACSKASVNQRSVTNSQCTVLNPETKFQFNLQSLMNIDFTANSTNNRQYKFRICGPILDGGCPDGTGICDIKNKASAGTAKSHLLWQHGGPYLNYTNGVTCGNGQNRYTLIAFVCGAKDSASLPIVMKDEPCSLIIYWYTDLACDKRITCAQNETNLVPLIRTSRNYVVKALGKEFHINICRPVVPTPGLACPHGSAVCQAESNTKGQYTNEISLGFPDQNPVLDGDQNLILNYYQGSTCPENPEKNISSSFKFFCDYKGDAGLPEYKNYSNCNYIFEWRTNIVCGAVVGKWFSPCTIKDPSHPNELDLSLLYKKPIPRFVTTKGKNYSISICGGKEHCNGSAVCQETNGYGTFSHVTFDYRSKLIKLQYSNGTKCSKESYASELSLICNSTAGIGDPVLRLDANCSALFEWQTIVACPGETHDSVISSSTPSIIATEKTSGDTLTAYTSIQTWVISITLILVILVIAIWLYLRNPLRCAHLRSRISAITATKNHSRVQYSRVNTTEEARLLLDTSDPCNDGHIDSDDELLGV